MLEMCFSTAPGVTTSARATAVFVLPSAIRPRTSVLARRERAERAVAAVRVAPAHQLGHDLAVERRPAAGHALHGGDERLHVPHPLLEQVADPALAPESSSSAV